MKKNYVKPTVEVVEMESTKMLCYSGEKPHDRVYIEPGDFSGCMPVIIVLLITVFSIGIGVSYCI